MDGLLNLLDHMISSTEHQEIVSTLEIVRRRLGGRLPSECLTLPDQPEPDYYSYPRFVEHLAERLGRIYGYQTAYRRASMNTEHPVTDGFFKIWRATNRVPRLYYEAIDRMTFERRPMDTMRIAWSQQEIRFLIDQHTADVNLTNLELAHLCTNRFGRGITECSVKGQLDRQRKGRRLPRYRKPREIDHSII